MKIAAPALALTLALPATLCAAPIVLDWNTTAWTPGQLIQSFDPDPTNPGPDLTITITDPAGRIAQAVSATTLITGGISPGNLTLQLVTNFLTNLESILVRIDFHYPAGLSALHFPIHDIDGDQNSWREEVRDISATGDTLPNFTPSQLQPASATPTFQITGLGLAQLLTATSVASDDSGFGSASVSFAAPVIRTATFRAGAGTAGSFDPIESGIALGVITYTPNPVPEPAIGSLLLLGALLFGKSRPPVKVRA